MSLSPPFFSQCDIFRIHLILLSDETSGKTCLKAAPGKMAELCLKRLLTDGSAEFSGAIRYRRANVEFDLNTHQILQHASKQNQRELAKYRIKNNTIGHKTQNCAQSLSINCEICPKYQWVIL